MTLWRSPRRGMLRLSFAAVALVAFALAAAIGARAAGLDSAVQFFRIGTGSTAGTYFPVGGIIASAISNPPGSRDCDKGGSCGVPGLIAVAQSTLGSVENVRKIQTGQLDSGFSQSDIAYWAYHGERLFGEEGPQTNLRSIANLFPESVQIVVRRQSGISRIADLKGKRISVDRVGSGTHTDALLILGTFGLGPENMELVNLSLGAAADQIREGELDGLFIVAGTPTNGVSQLADESLVTLVSFTEAEMDRLVEAYPFFSKSTVESGTYFNVPFSHTLAVGAQWLVSSEIDDDLVYAITAALWHNNIQKLLYEGHQQGQHISLENALSGVSSPPLHPGAARFYRERGMLP